MAAYYNEIEPFAAEWLRNLIAKGLIPPGDVDTRSIVDVKPDDLKAYTQCHFFAGIGVWSYALRRAGWDDDRPVWTGSCPCQPFSVAGSQSGTDDERHLWPAWFNLVRERRPPVLFGEQVEAAIGHGWLDALQADLEVQGYATAAACVPAAGVGAHHIRQRLWFGAYDTTAQPTGCLGDAGASGLPLRECEAVLGAGRREEGRAVEQPSGSSRSLDDPDPRRHVNAAGEVCAGRVITVVPDDSDRSGPTHVDWRAADWLLCRDAKWRAVEPGTRPLADGLTNRVGRLRAYGNAIVPQVASEFIQAFEEARRGGV